MVLPLLLLIVVSNIGAVFASSQSWDPSDEAIRALNTSIGGRLHVNHPFALPCFTKYEGKDIQPNKTLCAERQKNYRSPLYRKQFPGGYMYDQSSICASDVLSQDQCLLDLTNPENPAAIDGVDCRQGNLPSYYIDVRGPQEVIEAFRHAKKYDIRLSIKNSGHSFIEDSTSKGSVVLWTRNLKNLSHSATFVPKGCPRDHRQYAAITTGAGIDCGEAYSFANDNNATIMCGYASTVGLSGGWVQNGGHSVMSNVFGLGADRVLQFTVVTPDGTVRIANECQNTDLFWALRGGGGGTFGVVIDSTHKVENAMAVGVASIALPSKDKSIVTEFMELLFDTAIELADDGWGGHIYGNSLVYVSPMVATKEAATKSMAKIIDFAESYGGSANITVSQNWHEFFSKYVLSGAYTVGDLSFPITRLVPIKAHTDPELTKKFKAYMREFIEQVGLPYVPVDSPYLYNKAGDGDTSVHPAWYSSLWDWGYAARWNWNSTLPDRFEVARSMQERDKKMQDATPGGGTYKNEANPFTKNWQTTFWGPNYERLLRIKQKYDPRRLLKCWKCIGWSDNDTAQSCYSSFQQFEM